MATLSGVVNYNGSPLDVATNANISAADVKLYQYVEGESPDPDRYDALAVTQPAADGTYSFTDVPVGVYIVYIIYVENGTEKSQIIQQRVSVEESELNGFVFTVKTDNTGVSGNDQFRLGTLSTGTYDAEIFWGDGTSDLITSFDQVFDGETDPVTHTYASAGTYDISIVGRFWGFAYNMSSSPETKDGLKLLDIKQWNYDLPGEATKFKLLGSASFRQCSNLNFSASDTIYLSRAGAGTINTFQLFRGTDCSTFNTQLRYTNSTFTELDDEGSGGNRSVTEMFRDTNISTSVFLGNPNTLTQVFRNASNFNQDLTQPEMGILWSNVDSGVDFMSGGALSNSNYNALLIYLASIKGTLNTAVTIHFGGSQYSAGAAADARAELVDDVSGPGWIITDGGQLS